MLAEVGISDRKARRYMEIARNLKSANFADLPASPTALLALSRMDPSDIDHGIESGAITPACRAPVAACPGGPSRPCLVRQIGPLD